MDDFEEQEIIDSDIDYPLLFDKEGDSRPGCLTWIIFFVVMVWIIL